MVLMETPFAVAALLVMLPTVIFAVKVMVVAALKLLKVTTSAVPEAPGYELFLSQLLGDVHKLSPLAPVHVKAVAFACVTANNKELTANKIRNCVFNLWGLK